jgi:hypothetical protein
VAVIIPILRSGTYILPSLRAQTTSGSERVEAGPDFLGYERDFYHVKRDGNGVRLRFCRGEVWSDGRARVSVFRGIERSHVRMVFLRRVSQADHDMAIVSSSDPSKLDEMTRDVTLRAECRNGTNGMCVWVPTEIPVRPD